MSTSTSESDRLAREKSFHDDRFSDDSARDATQKFYEANSAVLHYEQHISDVPPNSNVLEYGCGIGSAAFALALAGANVTGIDISPVAIAAAEAEAIAQGCSANTTFLEANAEDTKLPAGSFDFVCGSGILHHLNLERSRLELHRLLHPAGRAVFLEPLGHNPAINWYRNRTPEMRTDDEHPLLDTDLEDMALHFSVNAKYFELTSLAAKFVNKMPLVGQAATRVLTKVDDYLLELPAVQKHAWIVVLELQPQA